MAISEEFVEDALRDLAPHVEASARRMFGGAGLYADGAIIGLCAEERLYLKVDEAGGEACRARGLANFDPYGNGRGMGAYFEVPLEDRADPAELARRVASALAAASNAKPKRRARRDALSALRNIGPVSVRMLRAAGISGRADLEERGAVAVWRAVCASEGARVSVNLLYALEGARTDRSWLALSPAERRSLRQRAGLED